MQVIQDIIAKGRINRPGAANSCTYITVHETGNERAGATAAAHAKYVKGLNERTSWHYTVDDSFVYQHLPDKEKSYHTSDADANENSISVELCVNCDGDFDKTVKNAAELVRELMTKHGIPAANIRSHRDWTGKNCPARLLANGWGKFLALCTADSAGNKSDKIITVGELRAMGYGAIAL